MKMKTETNNVLQCGFITLFSCIILLCRICVIFVSLQVLVELFLCKNNIKQKNKIISSKILMRKKSLVTTRYAVSDPEHQLFEASNQISINSDKKNCKTNSWICSIKSFVIMPLQFELIKNE